MKYLALVWLIMLALQVRTAPGAAPLDESGPADTAAKADPIPEELLKLRDPFKSPLIEMLQDDLIAKSELEVVPVEKFRMVGVFRGHGQIRAMISGPDGKTHFVTENTKIGVRKGVIKKITADTIFVEERMINLLGQEERSLAEIKLPTLKRSSLSSGN